MIADNRLTENSVWDERLLAEQLKELSELELDFSLEATGFEMGRSICGSRVWSWIAKTSRIRPTGLRTYLLDRRCADPAISSCWAGIASFAAARWSKIAIPP